MNLSLNLNPFFAKKVNPFSIKSEPILQNEPIRILDPFRSPFTKQRIPIRVSFALVEKVRSALPQPPEEAGGRAE